MKSFEGLVLAHLKDIVDPLLDVLQFAYQANRSVDDAVSMPLHYNLQHLDSLGICACVLFVDFSLVFNTMLLFSHYTSDCTSEDPLCYTPEVRKWFNGHWPHQRL